MTQKTAIFEEEEQRRLIGACESDNEFIPIWLMLRCGMHSRDVSLASEKLTLEGDFLFWKRVKNAAPRREMVPRDLQPKLKWWLARGRKLTPRGYYGLVSRVGSRIGHPECSPQTLRHTYCLQELRNLMEQNPPPPDFIALIAQKMGCSRRVVQQNYIDLIQWEKLGGRT